MHILRLMKEFRSESDVLNSGKKETRGSSSSVPWVEIKTRLAE